MTIDPRLLGSLRWRCSARTAAGASSRWPAIPTERETFYFGACAGGVWKTTDGGTYWENVSDGFFETAAVGAHRRRALGRRTSSTPARARRASAATSRTATASTAPTDGGRTWANVGLRDTRHIGRVRVHPRDPDLVYVAALGHAWGPNRERGVFRSRDGGATWEQVLFKSERRGRRRPLDGPAATRACSTPPSGRRSARRGA